MAAGYFLERERVGGHWGRGSIGSFMFLKENGRKGCLLGTLFRGWNGELPSMLWIGMSSSGPLVLLLSGCFPFHRPLWLTLLPVLLSLPGGHWLTGPPLYFLGGSHLVLTKWPAWQLVSGCSEGKRFWSLSHIMEKHVNGWTNSNKALLELQRSMICLLI